MSIKSYLFCTEDKNWENSIVSKNFISQLMKVVEKFVDNKLAGQ